MKKAKKSAKKSNKKSPKYQISVSIPIEKKSNRPSEFDEKIADEICEVVATCTTGIIKLCEENTHWPNHNMIYKWCYKNENFRLQYARAMAHRMEILAQEGKDICYGDNGQDSMIKVNRDRLKVDMIKWITCKLAPKIYGDKIITEQKINFDDLTPEQLRTLLDKMPEQDKLKMVEAIVKDYESKNQLTSDDKKQLLLNVDEDN